MTTSQSFISKNLQDTERFAQSFLEKLEPQATIATLVALHGDLGSGKTTFTQAVAKLLGVTETVTSPTFVIEKIYKLSENKNNKNNFSHLIHIDAYRLESGSEMLSLGWKELISNPQNLIFLEWPEKIADILPENRVKLSFRFVDENTREIVSEIAE